MGRMTALIQALLDPRCYPHPVGPVRLIETHISWLLLTGRYAYKIKKPVDLGFADFHTLDRRRRCCEEEIRLNRRFAPDIYLGVVPIAGPDTQPRIGGIGPAIEYAVQMREFDQADLLDARLRAGALQPVHVDALADACAAFHERAEPAAPASAFGTGERLLADALENFDAIERLTGRDDLRERIAVLRQWTIEAHAGLARAFLRRRLGNRIRECHGDLHLGNIVLIDERITLFDCIEFNPGLRWIDVMNEVAFTVMDLAARGRSDFAHRLLNRYLEASGDYAGLDVLPFYLVYRAMVRAKVDCIHAGQGDVSDETRGREAQDFVERIALAERFARPPRPYLAITCGVSGSGKTHLSQLALERTGAIRIRSDVERKRLSGLSPGQRSGSAPDAGIYDAHVSDLTFGRLADMARGALAAGFPVIVDATFILHARRRTFADLAAAAGVPFAIIECRAADDVVAARIGDRRAAGLDASEADLDVLQRQRQIAQPLERHETAAAIPVDTDSARSVADALDRLDRIATRS